ncbi:hypothetical protein HMPREF1624_01703 [Sporothrix schenckii ATCC 58251]|uniref:Uncharacterized protein n=1 Tax=Sporothrix schenckii (strain ATCC 58251 / de Perez 2211183) TaxID=1391915 RepID=U7Q6B6_SPOS1|nr:hypothetical protein HMPREF1624_01703 [Sporothrix schenckii ATCC 58251]
MRADFRSQYGPKYHYSSNYKGITVKTVFRYASVAGPIAGALGVAALFYASGIPRVQKDILQKIPLIGPYFVKTTHPADSPF